MYQDWDIAGGVAEFKKAVELDPNNAQVHDDCAFNISIHGGIEQEALAGIDRAHHKTSATISDSFTSTHDGSTRPSPSARSWQTRTRHTLMRTVV